MILSHPKLLKFGHAEMINRVGIHIKKPQDASHPGALS